LPPPRLGAAIIGMAAAGEIAALATVDATGFAAGEYPAGDIGDLPPKPGISGIAAVAW